MSTDNSRPSSRPPFWDERYAANDRLGPSTADRMVPVDEVRAAFADDEILQCEAVDAELHEGPLLRGDAAVVRLVARRR